MKQYPALLRGHLSSCKHGSFIFLERTVEEKAETKVILYSAHAINIIEGSIILRSTSGDTNIIIAISLIDTSKRVLIDYGNIKK